MNNKKLVTSVAAIATAAVLATGGTFAWQSINQRAINEASDVVNPGGRLHNDLNYVDAAKTNSDIYVENFADNDIFARVRLGEYFEVVMNQGVEGAEVSKQILGTKTTTEEGVTTYTYAPYTFGEKNDDGTFKAAVSGEDSFMNLEVGNGEERVYFMPTFNKNKDSLLADLNGTYRDALGVISKREEAQYKDVEVITAESTKTANAIYDADSNDADELANLSTDDFNTLIETGQAGDYSNNITFVNEEHTAKQVGETKGLISMADWIALGETYEEVTQGSYWVYDTDGWVYWSSPIKAGEATGLLLDSFTLNRVMDDTWYYAINVEGQFITANDSGKADGTGFYDTENGTVPSENAEKLLEMIGVGSQEAAEEKTVELKMLNGDEMKAAKEFSVTEISKDGSVKIVTSDGSSPESLGTAIKCANESGSIGLPFEASNYTYENGIFKLTEAGLENVADGDMVMFMGESSIMCVIAFKGDSTLEMRSSGATDYVSANVGEKITLSADDASVLTKTLSIDPNLAGDSDVTFTYSNGELTFTSTNMKKDLIAVTTDDGYVAYVILKSDDVTVDPTPDEPEETHTLTIENTKSGAIWLSSGYTQVCLKTFLDDTEIKELDSKLTFYAYKEGESETGTPTATASGASKKVSRSGDGKYWHVNLTDNQYEDGISKRDVVAEYTDGGKTVRSNVVTIEVLSGNITLSESGTTKTWNKSTQAARALAVWIDGEDGLPAFDCSSSNRFWANSTVKKDGEPLALTSSVGDVYENWSATIGGETVKVLSANYVSGVVLVNVKDLEAGTYEISLEHSNGNTYSSTLIVED